MGERSRRASRVADVQLARLPWLPVGRWGSSPPTLSGEADLSGRLDAPEGRLGLLLAGPRYRDQSFRDLALEAVLDGAQARIAGRLGEESLLSGQLRLEEQWPLHLDLELAALPLTQVAQLLPGGADSNPALALTGTRPSTCRCARRAGSSTRPDVESLEMDLGGGGASAGPFAVSGTREAVAIRGLVLRRGEGRLAVDGELGLFSDSSSPLDRLR